MTTSQALKLSEPTNNAVVPASTLAYFRFRFKQRIFDVLLREFRKSGITKAELARRLDKDPGQVSKLLNGPGNVTLDTVSDILFATSGAELGMTINHPLAVRSAVKKSTIDMQPGPTSIRNDDLDLMQPRAVWEYA